MDGELWLLFLYGALAIASVFMIFSLGRLAWVEGSRLRWKPRRLKGSVYFVITAALVMQSVALLLISALRVESVWVGIPIGGRQPGLLTIALSMLLAAKTGFHWAAMLGRRRALWRLFVIFELVWMVVLMMPRVI